MKLNKNNFKLITCAMSAMMIFSLVGCGDNSNQKVDIFSIGALEGQTMEVDAAANGKHDWKEEKRVAATASANGYVEYKCKNCTETYREVLVYSVNTGVRSVLTPVAAIVLHSGTAFLGVKKSSRKEEE